jgi:nucleotide-binding universal stress UspA family protein
VKDSHLYMAPDPFGTSEPLPSATTVPELETIMSTSIRTIVVGVYDLQNDPVLAAAMRLAERLGARLHALHAFEIPYPVQRTHEVLGTPGRELRGMYERELCAQLEAEVSRLSPGSDVQVSAIALPAGEAIVAAAAQAGADLIMVGATRQGLMIRHILGSTADRVIRTSAVPVLVLRPPFSTDFRRVLLTTDLSDASAAALRRGAEVAKQLAVSDELEVRCAMATAVSEWIRPAIPAERLYGEAGEALTRFLDTAGLPIATVVPRVRLGDAAKEIVAEAVEWNADLIVVGTRGRSSVSRFLLGSVAGSVLRSAFSDVLVVPPPADRHSPAEADAGRSAAEPVPAPDEAPGSPGQR